MKLCVVVCDLQAWLGNFKYKQRRFRIMDKARFSPSGEFLSVCGSDGRLRIWDTKGKSSCLKQEFVPSAHLSATCTCIEWAPSSSTSNAKNGVIIPFLVRTNGS